MKIVVIGGSGLIGSKVVKKLSAVGHQAVPASLESGVNILTGQGLAEVLKDASVLVDVSNSPTFDAKESLDFFTKATRNLLKFESDAGVRHHVALSVVGIDRQLDNGYMRAKLTQENLIKESSVPYSIVHATQFFEFTNGIVDSATSGSTVRVPPVLFQPMAAEDVAVAVAKVAAAPPLNCTIEIGGPEQFRFDDFVRKFLAARHDLRQAVADPHAQYFGVVLTEGTLVPDDGALRGEMNFAEWLASPASQPPPRKSSTAAASGSIHS